MKINGCTKSNAPTDPDMGQNFSPELECPDRLVIHNEGGRIISVDCNDTCPHHEDYKKDILFISAPNCTGDNKHTLIEADSPYYRKCTKCGEQFALISKTTLDELNIQPMERKIVPN